MKNNQDNCFELCGLGSCLKTLWHSKRPQIRRQQQNTVVAEWGKTSETKQTVFWPKPNLKQIRRRWICSTERNIREWPIVRWWCDRTSKCHTVTWVTGRSQMHIYSIIQFQSNYELDRLVPILFCKDQMLGLNFFRAHLKCLWQFAYCASPLPSLKIFKLSQNFFL